MIARLRGGCVAAALCLVVACAPGGGADDAGPAGGTPSGDAGGASSAADSLGATSEPGAGGPAGGTDTDGAWTVEAVRAAGIGPDYAVTDAAIANPNLDHGIALARQRHLLAPGDAGAARTLVQALLTRVKFRNTFADLDEAAGVVRTLVERSPDDPAAHLLQAEVHGTLHEFVAARAAIAAARARGANDAQVAPLQASLDVATGAVANALPVLEARAEAEPSYPALSALAVAVAAAGDRTRADGLFVRALDAYGDVSPFAVAWVLFQRAELAVQADADVARRFYVAALAYLPDYVLARVHLAELDAAQGDHAAAIARLEATLPLTDDPDVRSVLAAALVAAGRADAAAPHVAAARSGFDLLLARHPLAFADHAAEFFAGPGQDPERALALARRNLENRDTPAARALLARAEQAAAGR